MRQEVLEDIMAELDINDIHQSGDWLNASCPFAPHVPEHKSEVDSSPSFGTRVNNEGISSFHCFTCGNHGTIYSLINRLSRYRGEDYKTLHTKAIKADADIDVVDWDTRRNRRVTTDFKKPDTLDEKSFDNIYKPVTTSGIGMEYLKSRCINNVAIERFEWPLALAFICLFLEMLIKDRRASSVKIRENIQTIEKLGWGGI